MTDSAISVSFELSKVNATEIGAKKVTPSDSDITLRHIHTERERESETHHWQQNRVNLETVS